MDSSVKVNANKADDNINPDVLRYLASPSPGEVIEISVAGETPFKDTHYSIRNPKHRKHYTFRNLRQRAIDVMAGRKWYDGPIKIDFTLYAPVLERSLSDYGGGISDTLDGSHGFTFTYLPIVYQDDCQITDFEAKFKKSPDWKYNLKVTFL